MTAPLQPYRRLVASLFGALKLTQLYGRGHDATFEALRELHAALADAMADGPEIELRVHGARLLVNGRAMRASECGSLALGFLCNAWLRRGIETLRVRAGTTGERLGDFAVTFLDADEHGPGAAKRLAERLEVAGLAEFAIEERVEEDDEPAVLEERRQAAMRTYMTGLRAFRDVLRVEGIRNHAKLRRARRAVHTLVDRFLEDETTILTLAQIRGHDPKLFHHSLNVCIYSLTIGQRLGMTRRQLGGLGLAALFHDIGKTLADGDGPGLPRAASQWKRLHEHPGRGGRLLLEAGGTQESMLKAAIAAYEHHAQHDRNGFPHIEHGPHLVSRIVAVADAFEALTATRSYRETPYSAHEAFALLFGKAGTLFDPLLLKVFVAALGIHPIGELVELTTGERALVCDPPTDPEDLRQPHVRVVDRGEGALAEGTVVDLAERADDGAPARGIRRTLAPHQVYERVGEFADALA